ncbi:MAG TPA: hypothetical protein VMU96_12260, partial [Casimicrobiaceae bacterium]|nr:hypothetical protein [Casimicrobiaceae bacterium]
FVVGHLPMLLFVPVLYLALALVAAALGRRDRLVLALVGSGVIYELSYFIAAPSVDYRYSAWMIATTVVAACLVATERIRARAAQRTPAR